MPALQWFLAFLRRRATLVSLPRFHLILPPHRHPNAEAGFARHRNPQRSWPDTGPGTLTHAYPPVIGTGIAGNAAAWTPLRHYPVTVWGPRCSSATGWSRSRPASPTTSSTIQPCLPILAPGPRRLHELRVRFEWPTLECRKAASSRNHLGGRQNTRLYYPPLTVWGRAWVQRQKPGCGAPGSRSA